jgi:hypothetical protein
VRSTPPLAGVGHRVRYSNWPPLAIVTREHGNRSESHKPRLVSNTSPLPFTKQVAMRECQIVFPRGKRHSRSTYSPPKAFHSREIRHAVSVALLSVRESRPNLRSAVCVVRQCAPICRKVCVAIATAYPSVPPITEDQLSGQGRGPLGLSVTGYESPNFIMRMPTSLLFAMLSGAMTAC